MSIKNVALIGGTGTLGAPVLKALKASPFTIHVLNRASSKSNYSDTKVISIPDDLDVDAVASAFSTHKIDALIITIAGKHVADQKKLIDAAFKGGVKRVMPAEFGSCDSADNKTNEVLPLMAGKKIVRDYLIETSQKERASSDAGAFTWTSLVTGHFFDYGLGTSLLKFDVKGRKAYLLDGGNIKFSGSNLEFIGRAVVKILEKPEQTANKILYVHSHHVTQIELLEMLEKVLGEKFERVQESSEEELKKWRPKMLGGDAEAVEEVVAVWGVVAADWIERDTFANGLLGLEEEDLEQTVRRVVEKL